MKLLRFNSIPVDIDVNDIQSITPINTGSMQVTLKNGNIYKGYHLKL